MTKAYLFTAIIGFYLFSSFEHSPFSLAKIQVLKEGKHTFYVIPENKLDEINHEEYPSIRIEAILDNTPIQGGLQWGNNTEAIQKRVLELREESSMFNRILAHLEESEYPYSINNSVLGSAYGSYSSKKGEVSFEIDKMHDFFFDATIIEEFVHAYQALYYNYTHAKFRTERQKRALAVGRDFSKQRNQGLVNWKKFGRKHAFIESEAKLMTYFIQHQTCSISLQDIVDTDDYNTGGKGRKTVLRYLTRKSYCQSSHKKLGHLGAYFIDLATFNLYQQRFMKHWRRKAPNSSYTKGYFYHRPDALNNVFQAIACSDC